MTGSEFTRTTNIKMLLTALCDASIRYTKPVSTKNDKQFVLNVYPHGSNYPFRVMVSKTEENPNIAFSCTTSPNSSIRSILNRCKMTTNALKRQLGDDVEREGANTAFLKAFKEVVKENSEMMIKSGIDKHLDFMASRYFQEDMHDIHFKKL